MQLTQPFLLVLLLVPAPSSAAVAAGDNAAVYKQLCKLIRIAEAAADIPEPLPEATADYTELQLLNATLSKPEWLKLFAKKGPTKTRPPEPEGPQATDQTWKARWPSWLAAAATLDEDETKTKVYKDLKISPPNVAEKEARRIAITAELEAAARAAAVLAKAKTELGDNTKPKAQEALETAAFGSKGKTAKTVIAGELKEAGAPSDSTELCGAAGSSTGATSLTGLMMCICAKTNSGNGKEAPCTSTDQDSTAVTGNFANIGTLMPKLVENCPERGKKPLTGDEVRQALTDFKGSASRTNSQTVFGKFVATDCHGHSNSGQCVLYNGNVATAKKEIDSSKWATQITAAADTIDAIVKHNNKVTPAQERIRQAREAVITIMQLPLMPQSGQGLTTDSKTTAGRPATDSNQKKCEQHHSNQTECEKLQCTYDANAADGSKCKPKKAEGQTNTAAAGTGEQKTDSKCSDKKKQDDCKDGCKWEGETCKDSSILVNKQFALSIVSAASMALLF